MNELNRAIDEAKKIIIAGHVRPDGDCIGCLLYTSDAADD